MEAYNRRTGRLSLVYELLKGIGLDTHSKDTAFTDRKVKPIRTRRPSMGVKDTPWLHTGGL